jgi:hypothetical protein
MIFFMSFMNLYENKVLHRLRKYFMLGVHYFYIEFVIIYKDSARTAQYFCYFHSIIQYGIIFWGNSTNISRVFKLQRK